MGNMIPVMLLTDTFDQLDNDPKGAVNRIWDLATDGGGQALGGGMKVLPLRHSSSESVIYCGRNSFIELPPYSAQIRSVMETNPAVVQEIIDLARSQIDALERMLQGDL